jgi:hypothetical protein
MQRMNYDIWDEVDKRIQRPNEAGQFISDLMENCKDKTFNGLIPISFTNPVEQIQNSIAAFCSECNKTFGTKAIFLEMNGFDINPDRWYFDLFGYKTFPQDNKSMDWISDWQSPEFPDVTLTGLESIQELFDGYIKNKLYKDEDKAYNEELATLLVMAKFCQLIDKSLENQKPAIRVLVSAHDFDIFYYKSV